MAFALSSATFLITGSVLGDTNEIFLDYGWRIPFLLSGVLVLFGLWIRLTIEETPVFRVTIGEGSSTARPAKDRRLPITRAWSEQRREILLSAGALASLFAFFYIGTAYLTSYASKELGIARPFLLWTQLGAAILFGAAIAVSAALSDRVGRRKIVMASCLVAIPWSLILFPLLDTGHPAAFVVGTCGTLVLFGTGFGPTGALLPELFKTEYRYTGAGLGYNLAGVLGGALPPLLATPLIAAFGSISIGIMLAVLSIISLVSTKMLVERTQESLV
jgi:MFS family permease